MGMFDNFYVHKSVISDLFSDDDERKDILDYLNEGPCKGDQEYEYYYFQTKSLEKSLSIYYLKEDYKLYIDKKSGLEFMDCGDDSEQNLLEFSKTNYTGVVDFYDYFNTEKDYVSLEIKATFFDGVLCEHSIERFELESLEDIAIKNKLYEREREKLESRWEMKVYRSLQNLEWNWTKCTKGVRYRYNNFLNFLKKRAIEKSGSKIDIL